ncbi:hypothetical protein FXO38_26141 [Capsicum annuum]|nr:hypothetical protein FXO38_26141 [Capsicum annuum]
MPPSWTDEDKRYSTGCFEGDHSRCAVVVTGIVVYDEVPNKIKMSDGIVMTLGDVWYVPNLKKNLISLSTLDLNGYRYTGEGGVLKVTKGDATVSTSSLSESNVAKLRHVSENGMDELSRRGLLDGTIMEKVCYIISNAGLSKSFWAEAFSTTCLLINRSPSIAIDKRTPQEVWSGTPVSNSDLSIFGCPAYAHIDNGKLEPRSVKCLFMGYKPSVKGYKLWCLENRKVIISRDVVFDKTTMLWDPYESSISPPDDLSDINQQKSSTRVELQIGAEFIPTSQSNPEIQSDTISSSPPMVLQYFIAKDRPRRDIKPSQKYAEADLFAYALSVAEGSRSSKEDPWHGDYEGLKEFSVIFRYLHRSVDVCLQFGRNRDGVIGYVDSDFTGDHDKRRSLSSYVFTIGGCAISWKATLQTTVALSTTEVEYMVITKAFKEAIWLKSLFGELNKDLQITTVFCDSQNVIFLKKDQIFHERIKHIDV